MSDISKINYNNTSFDIKDRVARETLSTMVVELNTMADYEALETKCPDTTYYIKQVGSDAVSKSYVTSNGDLVLGF